MYERVEAQTRTRLDLLPPGDLDAVVRFFEAMQMVGGDRND
jgi:hypothetical protein